MKKSKFIIPALSAASIAAVVAPLTTSCSIAPILKLTASCQFDAANTVGGKTQFIPYTSKVEKAPQKSFSGDIVELAKCVDEELEKDANILVDDFMLVTANKAESFAKRHEYDNPTRMIYTVKNYSASSYKALPEPGWNQIIFNLNFDYKMETIKVGNDGGWKDCFELNCINVPFVAKNFTKGFSLVFDPQLLDFCEFKLDFRYYSANKGTVIDSSTSITDYNTYRTGTDEAILRAREFMQIMFSDNPMYSYHFENWNIN